MKLGRDEGMEVWTWRAGDCSKRKYEMSSEGHAQGWAPLGPGKKVMLVKSRP